MILGLPFTGVRPTAWETTGPPCLSDNWEVKSRNYNVTRTFQSTWREPWSVYGNPIYTFHVYTNMSDVLSVRVAKELKRRAEELGINIREVVENALERAIEEREREELKGLANKIKELMRDVREEDWLNDVKGSRNER